MKLYARKRNGTWSVQAVFFAGGRRVERWHKTGVLCNDANDSGKQKALRIGRQWADEIEKEVSAHPNAGIDVATYCTNYLDSKVSLGQIELSTRHGYTTYLNYIRDYFGEQTVGSVQTSDVEGFVVWLRDDRQLCQNSVKKAYNVLKGCFRHAVVARELKWNPCDPIPAPRQEATKPNPMTDASRRKFLQMMSVLELSQEVVGVWIAYYTGCRRGEIAHLRWSDITFAPNGNSIATVADAIGVKKGGTYEKDTKGHNTRIVPLPDPLVEILKRRREIMFDECMYCGVALTPDMFVCGDVSGKWIHPQRLTHWWTSHRNEWGLVGVQGRPVVLHDLRHTYATIAVRSMDPKTAQSIMGHHDINMTMSYAATDLSHINEAGRALGVALG